MVKSQITNSFLETQELGQNFAHEILAAGVKKNAVVLTLQGNLGAGKTTFLQGFAKGLGIKEVINSPTFVIMKKFEIPNSQFSYFYHFDLYRFEHEKDSEFLSFQEIISDPKNIVAIEWPEKLGKLLSKKYININFIHRNSTQRVLKIDVPGL